MVPRAEDVAAMLHPTRGGPARALSRAQERDVTTDVVKQQDAGAAVAVPEPLKPHASESACKAPKQQEQEEEHLDLTRPGEVPNAVVNPDTDLILNMLDPENGPAAGLPYQVRGGGPWGSDAAAPAAWSSKERAAHLRDRRSSQEGGRAASGGDAARTHRVRSLASGFSIEGSTQSRASLRCGCTHLRCTTWVRRGRRARRSGWRRWRCWAR